MNTHELYFKTAFACMSCDGDIADEEVQLIRDFSRNSELFRGVDIDNRINDYVGQINKEGTGFLLQYLDEVGSASLTIEEQIQLLSLAVKMIYADNVVQYSEVIFFKKIRKRLSVSDSQILERLPDIEDFLLPDLDEEELYEWDTKFEEIELNVKVEGKGE